MKELRTENVELRTLGIRKLTNENLERRTGKAGLQSFLVLRSNF